MASKITLLSLFLFLLNAAAHADEKTPPPNIPPFEIPTFTGKSVDWKKQLPPINPLPHIDGDAIFKAVNRCYPLKSGFGLDISLRAGTNYKPSNSNTVQTFDSNTYYAGIVANMPLYSDIEIDKERKLEYQRRMETTATIKAMLEGVANKRRATRMMDLYTALEKRSQERIKHGLAEVQEQIALLEKVAATQGELDQANATIEASRLALIGQCRPEVEEQVSDYILHEIGERK